MLTIVKIATKYIWNRYRNRRYKQRWGKNKVHSSTKLNSRLRN